MEERRPVPSVSEFDRGRAILLDLEQHGRVEVAMLADRFGVSTVTLRKDLERLERRGMLRRIRGGALAVPSSDEGAFDMRLRQSEAAKRAIAKEAAKLVKPGNVIAIDSSTTGHFLAQELLDLSSLVVITNGLRTAQLFLTCSQATVLMPGGMLRRSAESMVGHFGDVLAGRGRINKGFFGLVGLSLQRGLMDIAPEEAQAKEAIADVCDHIYGLFDSSKVGRFGMHAFVTPERITQLISDDAVPADVHEAWGKAGIDWVLVGPATTSSEAPARRTDRGRR